ncbi:MAG: galactonate dehydratase [Solirubrobacteraceae bacterium]|jgi:galactonate dehydratase|nr:galactonate dehydratase [Solirubrobacteraceae bacterium]
MKIVEVRSLVLGTAWRNLTFVVVRTDDGLEGVGEVRMVNNTEALLAFLRETARTQVIGADPFDIEALVRRVWRDNYQRAGDFAMAVAAVLEMACWDIVGKATGQPVYRLLGGAVRDRIKAYANGWYKVERTPEGFHAAAGRVVEAGYRALKFDPFGAGWYELERDEERLAVELVEAVRDAVGPDVEIFIEMHGRFTPAQAIEVARRLEPFRPGWIEEPVPPENIRALQKVSERVRVPVATGERIHTRHEFREVLELQAADVIQPDLTMCGGILETKKIAAWAEAYYVLVAPHNVGGPVSTAAALHLAACTPNFKVQEHFNDFAEAYVKHAAPGNPEVVDGAFALPEGPGLGVALDEDMIKEHPPRAVRFDLFESDWHLRLGSAADEEG